MFGGIKYVVNKSFNFGRLAVCFSWRSRRSSMGRFGGGWNWNVGFQIGGTTLIVNMLVCSLRISLKDKTP